MIGWENNQGAYFVNKLEDQIDALEEKDSDIQEEIGDLSDLTTSVKTDIVSSINSLNEDLENATDEDKLLNASAFEVTGSITIDAVILKKFGPICVFQFSIGNLPASESDTAISVGSLKKYKPAYEATGSAYTGNYGARGTNVKTVLKTDGTFSIYAGVIGAGSTLRGTVVYFV